MTAREREAMKRVCKAARVVAMKYDDFSEPVGGCPRCDPEKPAAYNRARLALYNALRDLAEAEKEGGE